jgi:NAD(P)-dependent dehydrogenase (short-subunit alcohol dehydrogenase family)
MTDTPRTSSSDAHTATKPLTGRRVLITGGTTGIGRAIAALLASEGAKVFIGGSDPDHLREALARLREVGEADGCVMDLSEADNVAKFVDAGVAALGGLDVAIANAAVAAQGLGEMDEAALRHAIGLNFTAYLLFCRHALDHLDGSGDVVMIGSTSAYVLGPESTVYAAIKYGIQGFAEAFRREQGPKGIRVSLVEPGKTGSTMQEPDVPPEEQRELIAKEEMLRAEDIAVGVHYLLTQPNRTVVQQLTIVPRVQPEE